MAQVLSVVEGARAGGLDYQQTLDDLTPECTKRRVFLREEFSKFRKGQAWKGRVVILEWDSLFPHRLL